jgi:hypothetical protein
MALFTPVPNSAYIFYRHAFSDHSSAYSVYSNPNSYERSVGLRFARLSIRPGGGKWLYTSQKKFELSGCRACQAVGLVHLQSRLCVMG